MQVVSRVKIEPPVGVYFQAVPPCKIRVGKRSSLQACTLATIDPLQLCTPKDRARLQPRVHQDSPPVTVCIVET